MNRVVVVAALTELAHEVSCTPDDECSFRFPAKEICGTLDADVSVKLTAIGDRTRLDVINITYWCNGDGDHDLAAQRVFEELVIRKLGGQRVSP
jgi:hypothetical protein